MWSQDSIEVTLGYKVPATFTLRMVFIDLRSNAQDNSLREEEFRVNIMVWRILVWPGPTDSTDYQAINNIHSQPSG